ncbi:MAG TPA: BatD family protein [Polyangiaceae bacterium]
MRLLLLTLAASLALILAGPARAWAQTAPQLQVQADQDTVGVGDILHLELTADSGDAMPTDPQPGATPGFSVRGASSSTRVNIGGNRGGRFGLTVDWALQAQRVGVFTVGPPSVVVGSSRFAARAITVKVVPSGQAPHRPQQQQQVQPQQPFGFSPFDPWRGLFPGLDHGMPDEPAEPPNLTTDPKLALDAARGNFYFLHAVVDTPAAVVGQQVTFSVYEYIDMGAGVSIEVDGTDVHDPTAADFVKHSLQRDDQDAVFVGFGAVAGRTWKVNLVRRWALFPIHAGDLAIGPMSVSLVRPRSAAGSKRTTENLRIHVTEPPAAGRPPGYTVGDVGKLTLSAQVTPRQVDQGGAVGVHLELAGTGSVPAAVPLPVRPGVEWLAPEEHDQLGATGHDTFGGKRSFDYVVRLHAPGEVDLGEVALPFWDPEQRRYDVARANLGKVSVRPSAASPAGSSQAPEEMLAGLPRGRAAMEGAGPAKSHVDDSPVFWLAGVLSWPVLLGVGVAGRAGARRVATSWLARRASPATELKERLTAADTACRGADSRAADAAIARALEAASIAHAGVSVRGAVGGEVVERLERAGVATGTASGFAELMRECEAARFAPDLADVTAARERWARARRAIREMERR